MAKIAMIKILQDSAVSYTNRVRWTNTIILQLQVSYSVSVCAKNYESRLAVNKVIAIIIRLTFFWPTL